MSDRIKKARLKGTVPINEWVTALRYAEKKGITAPWVMQAKCRVAKAQRRELRLKLVERARRAFDQMRGVSR